MTDENFEEVPCDHPSRPAHPGAWRCDSCGRNMVLGSDGAIVYQDPTRDEEQARRDASRVATIPPPPAPKAGPKFQPGDVVQLKSGGVRMTVRFVRPDDGNIGFLITVSYSRPPDGSLAFGQFIATEVFDEAMLSAAAAAAT